jgi:hypothetical protein
MSNQTLARSVRARSGTPEGTETANVGDLYVRTDDATVWVKATGAGTNTGWTRGAADGMDRWTEVAVSSVDILALRATPKTLVAAPGSGKVLEFLGSLLILDATATAYVESSANLSVRYENTTGAKASDDIEATGFIDQTADTMTTARPKADAIVAKTGCENKALVLHNLGAGEYTTGTGVMRVKVSYRVWSTGW